MPGLIRAFIAIELPDPVINHLKSMVSRLKNISPHEVRWTALQNLHLTLKFLGNTTSQELKRLETRLTPSVKDIPPFRLCMDDTGVFPNRRNPRIIWAGIHASEPLEKLYQTIELESVHSGFRSEGDSFTPHLTLGRIRDSINREEISAILMTLDTLKVNPAIEFEVNDFSLFQSDLRPEGPVYSRLAQFKLSPSTNDSLSASKG